MSGVFAIAYITSIMFGDDPTLCIYKNDMMRRHLYQCLVSGKLTPFPRRLKDTMGQQVKARDMILKFIATAECPN